MVDKHYELQQSSRKTSSETETLLLYHAAPRVNLSKNMPNSTQCSSPLQNIPHHERYSTKLTLKSAHNEPISSRTISQCNIKGNFTK